MLSLDTNIVIAIMTERSPAAIENFRQAILEKVPLAMSAVVLLELWYGAARSANPERNRRRIDDFLSAPIDLLDFSPEDAMAAGDIRASLEAAGTPIGPHDLQIAGQAKARRLTVVTDNEREFRRVPHLEVINWLRA